MPIIDPRWQHRFAAVNGVRLHYVEAGKGPLVLLLHGFPELWYGWRHQIQPLADAGYRVVAPDLRGYNYSDKPRSIAAYTVDELVADVRGLITSLGAGRASLVGHDWGGGIGWAFAMRHAELLERLCVLNCPHPLSLQRGLARPRQLARSWYMFFFQLRVLPELVAGARDYAALFAALERGPLSLTAEERQAYRAAFAQPGALRSMINYYRALPRSQRALTPVPIEAPVLMLWGDRDPHLGRELAPVDPLWVPRLELEYLPGAGHFIQHERSHLVNRRLLEFLGAGKPARVGNGAPRSSSSPRSTPLA